MRADHGTRTRNPRITSAVRYQLRQVGSCIGDKPTEKLSIGSLCPMSILSKPWVRSGIRYLAAGIVIWIAIAIYTGESDAPVLESFEVSNSEIDLTKDDSFEFSGVISDERGISNATLECIDGEKSEFVIVVATSGINKYRVAFGKTSSSPNWIGRWEGTKQLIEFEGIAEVPLDTQNLQCEWQASLVDSLGNEITTPAGVVMTVTSK